MLLVMTFHHSNSNQDIKVLHFDDLCKINEQSFYFSMILILGQDSI